MKMPDPTQLEWDDNTILCEVMEDGKLPIKAHITDAGFDLFATSDIEVRAGEIVKHPLNIRLQLLPGTYMEITSKSGLGSKGLLVYAGIIDESYRGIPHVVMTNLCYSEDHFYGKTILSPGEPIIIKKGQKVAQGIIHPFGKPYKIIQVLHVSTDTSRGEGGFGSSGR